MATHDKRLRKKEAKRSKLRRIADGEDVDDDDDDEEFSEDSEDDDTDRREEVRIIIKGNFNERNFNGASLRQFWMDILQEKPVGPPSGSTSSRKKFKVVKLTIFLFTNNDSSMKCGDGITNF